MRGLALSILLLGTLNGLVGCLKKPVTEQSALDNHVTKMGMLSAGEGFLKPENTRIGIYFNGKIQFCQSEQSIAEFHIKDMDHHSNVNKLWGFVCINKEATTAKLYDGQNHIEPAASIDLMREKDTDPKETKDDSYRFLDGFSSEYIDSQNQGSATASSKVQVTTRAPLATLSPYKGSWWLPKITEYGATEIYSLQLARLDGSTDTADSNLVYVKNLFNLPLTETWRLLRKNIEGSPKSRAAAQPAQNKPIPGGTPGANGAPLPENDPREVARIWGQPGLFGWNLIDMSAQKNIVVDRRVIIMLPLYQELQKRRHAFLRDQGKTTVAPSANKSTSKTGEPVRAQSGSTTGGSPTQPLGATNPPVSASVSASESAPAPVTAPVSAPAPTTEQVPNSAAAPTSTQPTPSGSTTIGQPVK